uniref:Glycosyltransferase 2-like domain-containing protein n=1 Tax=viral metagenome TaxID=1070528 RepID=A0A6C0JGA0_9ZZZZ
MTKICLNMIVKNESKVIERLMNSVLPIIDSYCICDTGSTDNTVELIETFFEKNNIPGRIVREPFQDFGYNRTFALNSCIGLPNADYLLLLDADMKLRIDPNLKIDEFKESLKNDAYYIFQGSDLFFYKNVRILRNDPEYSYWGVTHEFVKTTEGSTYIEVDKSTLFIDDIGDGGAKADKFERDVRLLLKGLEENPGNDRYTFYLANSYRDAGQFENAIKYYEERIKIGGWREEVWHSYYSIGKCYESMGDMPTAISYWMDAYQFFPDRIENLYKIVNHYRCIGKPILAYSFYELASFQLSKSKSDDHLFLEKEIYDFKLDYEFTIVSYYYNPKNLDIVHYCMKVLSNNNPPIELKNNILSNYKFYSPRLKGFSNENNLNNFKVLQDIGKSLDINSDFVSSTPSICLDPNDKSKLIVNLRYVNYKIGDKGEYINKEHITTKNVLSYVNMTKNDWKIESQAELKYNESYDDLYVGLEDVRIMPYNAKLYFNANRGLGHGNMVVEHGKINIKSRSTLSHLIETDNQNKVEKNWVLFTNAERELKIIYGWNPLRIGNVIDHPEHKIDDKKNPLMKMVVTHEIKTPRFFSYLRGSTNGQIIGDEIWFICHLVSYEDRRYYYHIFVTLDSKTMELKRYSRIFTFEGEKVEYTLGFVYRENTEEFLIGYSLMDRETKYMTISKDKIEELFIL